MRNIWIICWKELRSYFVSPIAYLLLTMFALIFGFFFWNSLGYFVYEGMESQMRGQSFPMNLNEMVVRPLLSNVCVIGLFFIPMITMRLFAEEKRSGTIELLTTSPIRDFEIILGKWTAALALYTCMLLFTAPELRVPVSLWPSRLEAAADRIPRLVAAGGRAARHRHLPYRL
jgi:ABC-2 type transport system permease protein